MRKLKVLIVPDKFKGSLTAQEAAAAIAAGWIESRPADTVETLPMSDGGDGFGQIISALLGAELRTVATVDAAGRPREARWWFDPARKTAVIETAQVNGLALLPPGRFHPFELDTFGLGAVFRKAAAAGAESCLVGIGGSATNDAGFGLARALGWRFLDRQGEPILQWTGLNALASIEQPASEPRNPLAHAAKGPPEPRQVLECGSPLPLSTPPSAIPRFQTITIASDVQNPLLGPSGASRIYGPQKGLRPADFPLAEECLERLAQIVRCDLGIQAETEPGTGAAGGLGYGLRVFLNGAFEPGAAIFARLAGLEERVKSADLVITAEGSFDSSSLMGKGTGVVLDLCRKLNVPSLILAGTLEQVSASPVQTKTLSTHAIVPDLTDLPQSIAAPALWLTRLATRVASTWE